MTQQVIWKSFTIFAPWKAKWRRRRGDSGFATTRVQTDSAGLVQPGDNVLCRSLALKHCVISL